MIHGAVTGLRLRSGYVLQPVVGGIGRVHQTRLSIPLKVIGEDDSSDEQATGSFSLLKSYA